MSFFWKTYLIHMPYLRPKRLKTHTLWRRTYLYSPYKGIPPPPPPGRRKTRWRLWVSLLTHARVIKDNQVLCHLTVKPKVNVGCRLNFRQSRVPEDHVTRGLGNKFIESNSTTSTLSTSIVTESIDSFGREDWVLCLPFELSLWRTDSFSEPSDKLCMMSRNDRRVIN